MTVLACALLVNSRTLEVEVEGGPVWLSRNDAEIPNDGTGTQFSISDLTGSGPWLAGRVYLTWNLSETHGVRVLYAPLSVTEVGGFRPGEFRWRDVLRVDATRSVVHVQLVSGEVVPVALPQRRSRTVARMGRAHGEGTGRVDRAGAGQHEQSEG